MVAYEIYRPLKIPVAGLDPAIHAFSVPFRRYKTWMPGSSPGKGSVF
jgi:hypothetical protein